MGIPRALLYPDPVEFVVLPDRILQHFQWGYAIGRCDGDTLVVTSTGYDERTWIDHFGYPHSDEMVLEERYKRINFDTLDLRMVLTDRKHYAQPGTAQVKRMHLIPRDFIQSSGWSGLLEDLCAPVDEVDTFNRLTRDPAGTGLPPAPPPGR